MIRKHKPVKGGVLPKKYGAFDCETEGLHGDAKLICLTLNNRESKVFKGSDCVAEFVEEVTRNKYAGYHLYAHNLSFDLEKTFGKVFGNTLDSKRFTTMTNGSRLISAIYHFDSNKTITLLDSVNLIPRKLSEIGEDLGFEKLETPDKWLSGDPVTEIDDIDIEYCQRDCQIVMRVLEVFEELLKPFQLKLKMTIAANAKAVWKAIYLHDDGMFLNEKKDEKFRESYYGGRTEVFVRRHSHQKLYYHDVNSLYPSVMRNNKYPDPDKLKFTKDIVSALKNDEGCARLTVEVPDMKYPVLPVRTTKLIFPTGIFTGTWNFPEIRLALSKGYKIIETHWVLSSLPIDSPFGEYVDYFMERKIKYQKDGKDALALLCKLMLNSLYGKFAQRVDKEDKYTKEMPDVGTSFQCLGKHTYRLKNVERERGRETVVCWASYTSSYSRCVLYNYFPVDGLHYCDTDSTFTETPLSPEVVDDYELGLMALEHIVVESYFVAPKRYAIKTDDDEEIKCIKGINADIVKDIPLATFGADMGVTYIKPVKTKTGLIKNLVPYSKEKVRKNLSINDDKRVFSDDGTSVPIKLASQK